MKNHTHQYLIATEAVRTFRSAGRVETSNPIHLSRLIMMGHRTGEGSGHVLEIERNEGGALRVARKLIERYGSVSVYRQPSDHGTAIVSAWDNMGVRMNGRPIVGGHFSITLKKYYR